MINARIPVRPRQLIVTLVACQLLGIFGYPLQLAISRSIAAVKFAVRRHAALPPSVFQADNALGLTFENTHKSAVIGNVGGAAAFVLCRHYALGTAGGYTGTFAGDWRKVDNSSPQSSGKPFFSS